MIDADATDVTDVTDVTGAVDDADATDGVAGRCVACLESFARGNGRWWRLTCCSGRTCRACGDSVELRRSLERSGCPLCRSVGGLGRLILTVDDENRLVTTLRRDHGDPELALLDETTTERVHDMIETANEEMMRLFERAFVVEGERFEETSSGDSLRVEAFVDVATRLRRYVREECFEKTQPPQTPEKGSPPQIPHDFGGDGGFEGGGTPLPPLFVDDVSRLASPYLAFTFYLDDVYRTFSDVPEDVLARVRDLEDAFVAATEPETTFLTLDTTHI